MLKTELISIKECPLTSTPLSLSLGFWSSTPAMSSNKDKHTNENKLVAFHLLCSAPLLHTHRHSALLSDSGWKDANIKYMQKIHFKCIISVITLLVCFKPFADSTYLCPTTPPPCYIHSLADAGLGAWCGPCITVMLSTQCREMWSERPNKLYQAVMWYDMSHHCSLRQPT